MLEKINLKYRTWFKGDKPRPIKLEIPGWAGDKNHLHGQPWHCKPFIDGSTYGLELVYPFDTVTTVTTKDNKLEFVGNFNDETNQTDWERPFSAFAPHHFGFTSSVDIQTPEGYGTMILPHPRYYTDRTGNVPCVVAGLLETDWWPRIFFIVFKSPLEGQTYIFRKGEGYAHLIFVPKEVEYNITEMTKQEKQLRAAQEKTIGEQAKIIATRTWHTLKKEQFDNKYKCLSKIAKQGGIGAVADKLEQVQEIVDVKKEKDRKKFPRRLFWKQ